MKFKGFAAVLVTTHLICSTVSLECGVRKNRINKVIVRGQETSPGDWPWHAAIFHRDGVNSSYACGGTLISELFVLTAAHCVVGGNSYLLSSGKVYVVLGLYNLHNFDSKTFQQHNVNSIHRYDDSKKNDIALLKLVTQVEFTNYIQPVCVNQVEELTRQFGTAVGWGKDETGSISPVLKSTIMPVVSTNQCLEHNDGALRLVLDSSFICAGFANGTSVCNGDSGGGLHFERGGAWYIGGIVAFTLQGNSKYLCHTESYAVFTNIYHFLSWIRSITQLEYLEMLPDLQYHKIEARVLETATKTTTTISSVDPDKMPTNCGQTLTNRISGGNVTKVFDHPWMAVLRYKFQEQFVDGCSGTIIHQRYVLTAAKCLKIEATHELYYVILGEHTKNSTDDCNIYRDADGEEIERDCADPIEEYRVDSYVVHPLYKPTFGHDIGLIRLSTEITWKYHIRPICLPVTPQLRVKHFKRYIVTGWGDNENRTRPDVLMKAVLPRVSNADCQQIMFENKYNLILNDNQMCAGGEDLNGTCFGDFGGPLGSTALYNGVRFVQFGIVSGVLNTCGKPNVPSVFTRVANHMDWIVQNVAP